MPKLYEIKPTRTWATPESATRAVERKLTSDSTKRLRYFIHRHEATGRYFPVFIGMEAVRAGVHFHFNVVA